MNVQPIVNNSDRCGEAPIWDAAQRRFIWADITAGVMCEYQPESGETNTLARDLAVSGIALNNDGRLVIAGSRGILLWSKFGDEQLVLSMHDGETLNFNDILADPQGRLYAGTYYWGADGMERPGKLYLIHTNGTASVVDENIELSNGLGLSPDNRTLYYSDTIVRKIYAYDVESQSGMLRNKRVFVNVPSDEGIPDGLTVDSEGFVWSAQWYGGQVVRYDPEGKVARRIAIPAKQTSSVAFGGDDFSDLYVTTAGESWPSEHMPPGYDPNSGAVGGPLYRIRLGDIRGRPEHHAALLSLP